MAKAHLYQPRTSEPSISYYVLHKEHGMDVVVARSHDDGRRTVIRVMRERDIDFDALRRVKSETEDGLFTLDDDLITVAEHLLASREARRLSQQEFESRVGELRSFFPN